MNKKNLSESILFKLMESNTKRDRVELGKEFIEILKSKLSPDAREYIDTFIEENSIYYSEPVKEDPAYNKNNWNTPGYVFMSDYGNSMISDFHYSWYFDENNIEDTSKWVFKKEKGPYYNPYQVWDDISLEKFDRLISSLYRRR